ncbi:conserved Plasmodium protein, unknown function [Plasmodium knowlesi strain H]|uniref:Enkurin domain-containing protein n=3 Tax=Plasmodium knowlesi TaxID=5850 RepID=A0A5K1VIV4_PLAKH|nr:conserved Plasmodium protein, unknown function [Plasmodium knowlesi strain H]OTN66388.1 Uncharacterized protein PKNOH_S09527700 [Plasmodium knowlesi]CAA9990030.1 conserved Plasmodium protein, unknown function [Plasmodium knowlesi strain H]SBO24636.1 conserved Plasmodium protein, unknown function [Plasmodium knowlesi strain H]SBO26171.1 conserved Plasmodium protein, unknown function [Plasmodium knowlesi strain H]VVS79504.1 conserved Plasmodium protein, unknown function [Plasmodium knowlesi s|eukprot:XP_002260045.1 hypothetical protein, conserved in Plasmodium species [Plasmodium knowlesi strain H]
MMISNTSEDGNGGENEGCHENVEDKSDQENMEYKKPDTHTNFWKSFGLGTKAGKLLYHLYGEKSKITPALITKKKATKDDSQMSEPVEVGRRRPQVSYPEFKKPAPKEHPIDTIPHRKPLAKILEDTKNYECIKDLPARIEQNRILEKKKLSELFFGYKCKVLPPSCSAAVLTDEEKREAIQSAEKAFSDMRNSSCKEDNIKESMKIYQAELMTELREKVDQYNQLVSIGVPHKEGAAPTDKECNEYDYKKIQLVNEIEACKRNIKKTNTVLESSK